MILAKNLKLSNTRNDWIWDTRLVHDKYHRTEASHTMGNTTVKLIAYF